MFELLRKCLPSRWKKSFRQYVHSVVNESTSGNDSPSDERINHLQAHVENMTNLLTSTANNLNTVGTTLESIHQTQSGQIEELQEQLRQLQKTLAQVDISSILQYRFLPEVWPHDEASKGMIAEFSKQYQVDFSFNDAISKDDIMFLYSMAAYKDFNVACHNYFTIGYNGFSIVKQFAEAIYGPNKFNGQILDFASGYGRVTRFLAAYYGAEHISTSDIKAEAVEFQKQQLKVRGFTSVYDPSTLKVEDRYDFIFVGSLFSHLNEALFAQWLETLISLLTPNGHLLFTVHDQSLHPTNQQADFQFVENNEDEKFNFVGNRITSTSLYGISFVSESYVSNVLQKLNPAVKFKRYPKLFGGHQDLYLATIGGNIPTAVIQA